MGATRVSVGSPEFFTLFPFVGFELWAAQRSAPASETFEWIASALQWEPESYAIVTNCTNLVVVE